MLPSPRASGALLFLTLVGLCTVSAASMAQQPTQAQTNAIRQACRSDYMAKCRGVPTGGKAALQCLQQNLVDLSPACQDAVHALNYAPGPQSQPAPRSQPGPQRGAPPHGVAMAELREECMADFRTHCPNTRLGGGRVMGCLMENESRLSPGCRSALAEMRGGTR